MGHSDLDPAVHERRPWNAGQNVGQKRPLKLRDIWAIRFYLDEHKRLRDRALFDLGIDSKLRGCDLVKLRIGDLMSAGSFRDRATIIQQKTGRPRNNPRLRISKPGRLSWSPEHPAICPSGRRMGGNCRLGQAGVRHTLHAADQALTDIQGYRKPASRADPPRPYQHRKHRQVFGRGRRRCSDPVRAHRNLTICRSLLPSEAGDRHMNRRQLRSRCRDGVNGRFVSECRHTTLNETQ